MGSVILATGCLFGAPWLLAMLLSGPGLWKSGISAVLFWGGVAGVAAVTALLLAVFLLFPNSLGQMAQSTDCSGIYNLLAVVFPGVWLGAAGGMAVVLRGRALAVAAGVLGTVCGAVPVCFLLRVGWAFPDREAGFALLPLTFDTTLLVCSAALFIGSVANLFPRYRRLAG